MYYNFTIILLLLGMFLASGFNKINTFSSTALNIQNKLALNSIIANTVVVIVILLEILAPVFILYYIITKDAGKIAYYSTIALIVFTILATIVYHPPNFTSYNKSIPFWANMSLLGGLLLLERFIKE